MRDRKDGIDAATTLAVIIGLAVLCRLTSPHDYPMPSTAGIIPATTGEQLDAIPASSRVTVREYYRRQAAEDDSLESMTDEERHAWTLRRAAYLAAVRRPGGELGEDERRALLSHMRSSRTGPRHDPYPHWMVARYGPDEPLPDWVQQFNKAAVLIQEANEARRRAAEIGTPFNPDRRQP